MKDKIVEYVVVESFRCKSAKKCSLAVRLIPTKVYTTLAVQRTKTTAAK